MDALNRYKEQFFASVRFEARLAGRSVEPVAFGFTPHDATEISRLVLDGTKTATGSLLWSYEAEGKAPPSGSDLWVVIDGDSNPMCISQTTKVEIIPFDDVPGDYALWGGEGDRSLEGWRRMYWRYIVLECKRIGRDPARTAPMVMERFAVIYAQPLHDE